MRNYLTFKNLHLQSTPLLLANVWDVNSAKTMEDLGFSALGTSSAAVAHTLGYEDGEEMPFEELLFMVKKIAAKVTIPFTVDIEGGYDRDISGIVSNIKKLHDIGAFGINIEDSVIENGRKILPADDFGQKIAAIKKLLHEQQTDIFVNVRTDTYLLPVPEALAETKKRVRIYEEAGADGVFVPCIVNSGDIKEIVSNTGLPVNVMCMPDLPAFNELAQLGVKRISMGNFVHSHMANKLKETAEAIKVYQSFKPLF
ncbi:Putative carboxyvinyl-carboxyphosphonate phosphorylmutase [Fulvivirga imtechensis AK7]|uniref:Putative carboxyvinyl-carboxyphosphonate phosphorylmutase n=1 Tax=Fulvivirga imtechensis AK7 TaxID=1237149 RepID=L8JYW1_9BACT|nr:isocitrate lyase/phosphoenolpyruvate mutase family protein [Fulvivirga imtechensis]ELR72397.1 Putative carboxyvinyl-carboxyphosphonate phosphorylmutase [Fulvivirga imtechensis AK7]